MSIENGMPAQPEDESQKKNQGDCWLDVPEFVVDGLSVIGRGSRSTSVPQVTPACGDSASAAASAVEGAATSATETAAAGAEAASAGVEAAAAGVDAAAAAGEAAGGIVDGVASVIGGILDGF